MCGLRGQVVSEKIAWSGPWSGPWSGSWSSPGFSDAVFENLADSCGPRIWQALLVANAYVPAIAKCLQEKLSTSDLQPVSNKQMSNAYGGIGFCKEEAKTFAQLLYLFIPLFVTSQISTSMVAIVTSASFQSSLFYYPWSQFWEVLWRCICR